jgi:hypothetical protein
MATNNFGRNGDTGHVATETDKVLAKVPGSGLLDGCVFFLCRAACNIICTRDIYLELPPNSNKTNLSYTVTGTIQ